MKRRISTGLPATAGPAPAATRERSRLGVMSVVLALVATMTIALSPVAGQAQEPNQVTGLTATQAAGFTTLKWNPVPGAGEYEIFRTPVDGDDNPTGDEVLVGVWRPNRQVTQDVPTFADAGFNPGDRFGWQVRARIGSTLPARVTIDAPSSAAGVYNASQATYGPPAHVGGISANIVLVNDGTATPTLGCSPLVGFPAGAIALIDRGSCNFTVKTANAQAAGAAAVILINNTGGTPTNPTGTDASIVIPTVMVAQSDGPILTAGLPATGEVAAAETAPLSTAVYGTTLPEWGDPTVAGQNLRTQWETTDAAQYTSDVNEYAYTAAVDAASDRVRVVELGRTLQDRPINMFIIGYPAPAATAEEISDGPAAMVNCNVHGNEPSSRESCLILARELAFSTDPRVIDILSNTTVLIVPAINGDGRANNTRGNVTGQDLNRDHSLLAQPETFAFSKALRDYTPEAGFDGHEFGNNSAGDLPVLMPRHVNVAQSIFDRSKSFIEDFLYVQGSEDGWWYCPYGCQGGGSVGLSQETILRNTIGLKNSMGILLEARSGGGATRPNEGNTQNNRRRKTYSALYTYQIFLDYHRANRAAIAEAVDDAVEFQNSNTGPVVFRGSRPLPAFPAPHPGEAPPPNEAPSGVLEVPPACYLLTEAQYNGERDDSPDGFPTTVAERLDAHGIEVEDRPDGYVVRLAQPLRGLIPLLLDGDAAEPLVDGTRLSECPEGAVAPPALDAAAVEDTQVTLPLSISNVAAAPNADLSWSITEAAVSCDAPSDLGWVSAAPASGSTATSGSSTVTVTFDATGLTAPDIHSGVLCIATNDPGDVLVEVPVSLQVQYPFSGFAEPPAMTSVQARSRVPVRFSLDGDRGLDFFAAGSPATQQINCVTLVPIGGVVPASSGGPLLYDPVADQYRYVLDAPEAWSDTCRQLVFELDDASTHVTNYRFHR